MMPLRKTLGWSLVFLLAFTFGCDSPTGVSPQHQGPALKGGPPNPHEAGNNLSYPVIWAEGVAKVLPGVPGDVNLAGEYWYQWGTSGVDPNVVPLSCLADPDAETDLNPTGLALCDDQIPGAIDASLVAGVPPADNPLPLARAYVQKDAANTWQAGSADWSASPVEVHWIDWGDNLESVDWYTRSQVRTEVVLFQDLATAMTEYEMRHTSGWGIDEVHGAAALPADPTQTPVIQQGPGTRATVYSPCARFMIQKLNVERGDIQLDDLIWVPTTGWTEPDGYPDDLINAPIFNGAVHEASDGPGYYNAEINVKGRIIYGYTWNVRRLNEGAGDYRLTFSFDEQCGAVGLNTSFVDGVTEIIVPEEEDLEAAAAEEGEEPGGGGTGELDFLNNLTYMDISIHERGGGGGGGGNGGGGGGPPPGKGGRH